MGVVDAASVRAIHAATTVAKRAPGERVCGTAPTRKRPSHELTGIGRFPHLYSRTDCSGEWLPVGASLPSPSQRSHFELLAVGLPGPTGISPSQSSSIRSQDGSSRIHRISASSRNPLGSRTISMRSVHRDFQSPMTHLGRCGADGSPADERRTPPSALMSETHRR